MGENHHSGAFTFIAGNLSFVGDGSTPLDVFFWDDKRLHKTCSSEWSESCIIHHDW